jgi:hypothetical protein
MTWKIPRRISPKRNRQAGDRGTRIRPLFLHRSGGIHLPLIVDSMTHRTTRPARTEPSAYGRAWVPRKKRWNRRFRTQLCKCIPATQMLGSLRTRQAAQAASQSAGGGSSKSVGARARAITGAWQAKSSDSRIRRTTSFCRARRARAARGQDPEGSPGLYFARGIHARSRLFTGA